ncbi:class I SAM-dependent methyltransferase [bacterium]|nr:class I SAM-dependent methyltransferase [bacterium]
MEPEHKTTDAVWEGQVIQAREACFYNGFLASLLKPHTGSRILEIGMGIGNLTELLIGHTVSYIGIDNVNEHIRWAHERFTGRAFEGLVLDIEDSEALQALKEKEFDTIVSANCFEHLKDDAAVLKNLCLMSPPGTKFAFLVPAHGMLFGAMDVQAEHYRRYSRTGFIRTLEQSGFTVEGSRYFNMTGALAWFLMGKFPIGKKPEGQSEKAGSHFRLLYAGLTLLRLPLNVILKLETQIPEPFGLSLIVWGKKT